MPDGHYDSDILVWAEEQAVLLRRLAKGERVNAQVDWPHIIEELRDVGLSELRACESLLRQALVHLLKLRLRPDGPTSHWRSETIGFLADAQARFTPSMCQRIDLERLYRKALQQARESGPSALSIPETCPFGLDELLADNPDLDGMFGKLG